MKNSVDKIFITNLPSFYKINLYNEIAKNIRILVIYTGDHAHGRNEDFYHGKMYFDHIFLQHNSFVQIFELLKILRKTLYNEIIIGGWDSIPLWVAAFFSNRNKNAVVVESSCIESTTSGVKGFVKKIFISRISKVYASGKMQSVLTDNLGFKGETVITKGVGVFNYIDQPMYQPREKVKNFLYVGRLTFVKNLEFLITKFNNYPELTLTIIGFGELEDKLKSMANTNINFLGAVDNKDLYKYYQSADVFILPSISEPWGLVVEEALNNGTPVMVSNKVGCIGEVVSESNGVVFSLEKNDFDEKLSEIRDISTYNSMRENISHMDFAKIEKKQAACYTNFMPKLLQINSTANWGSTGRIAEQIGCRAILHGWDSYIAYGRYANASESKLIKIGSKLGILWHLVESRVWDNHGLASRIATTLLIRKIKKISPDIIHLHNIHGYYLNYKMLFDYLIESNIPVVWTLHDCWAFTGHCAFMPYDCNKWKSLCRHCKYKASYPQSLLFNRAQSNYKLKRHLFNRLGERLTIVPVSKWLAAQTRQSFLGENNINYIYNGVNVDIFHPLDTSKIKAKYNLDSKFVLLGVASSWGNRKGYYDYLKLREQLSDDYIIIMVGLSESQISKLPQGIIGIQRTQSQQELAEIYSVADIVLSLSRAETFGLTVAEGMACGTPAIVYNNSATPELITLETGVIVDKTGDVNGVIDAIKVIKSRGKIYYSSACRKRAEEYFDKNKCFDKYINLYNEKLNT